jgi:hypothetical protein
VRPGTSDRLGGSLAGPPADGAPGVRDARRVFRPRSRRLIGNATAPIRGGIETASRRMRWPPDDPADVRSDTPNRVSGTLTIDATDSADSSTNTPEQHDGWICVPHAPTRTT